MPALTYRQYRCPGVYIPWKVSERPSWSSEENIERDGFIHVKTVQPYVWFVQSIATGKLFVNKIFWQDGSESKYDPAEIRISTASNAERWLPGPLLVRGHLREYFNELALWQDLDNGAYSVYLKHYNGDSLADFIRAYRRRGRAVPEHFIWHLLLTLVEAVRYLRYGALPGTDHEKRGWVPIHHRDIAIRNIFLHYPQLDEQEPEDGFYENAFPEIVLGDFGHAAVRGDPGDRVNSSCWEGEGANDIADWHDTYSIGHVAKQLYLVATGKVFNPPEKCLVDNVDQMMDPSERPYSQDLWEMLRHFEYPNCDIVPDVTGRQPPEDPDGPPLGDYFPDQPNHEFIPAFRRVVDEWLPIIRDRTRRYIKPEGGLPVGWWKQLDVSWTQPRRLMPYAWQDLSSDSENNEEDNEEEDNDPEKDNLGPNYNELGIIRDSEGDYPGERAKHQVVSLEFALPVISEIRKIPPPPAPDMPNPIPPTPRGYAYTFLPRVDT